MPPSQITVAEWAERNVIIPPGKTEVPGRLSFDRTPYLREVVNCLQQPDVRCVTLCFGSQVGKTTALIAVAVFVVAADPAPVIFAISLSDLADDVMSERIEPIIDASPTVAGLKKTGKKDWTKFRKRFTTGGVLRMVGAQSPRQVKSRPTKLLLLDEIDDYKSHSQTQGGTLEQIKQRTKGWVGGKCFQASTPTLESGNVWREFLASSQEFFHVPCPHEDCRKFQKLIFSEQTVRWPRECRRPDGEWDIEKVRRFAFYECQHCHQPIYDRHKQDMLLAGKWIAENPDVRQHRGFHVSSLYAMSQSFGDVAAAFLQSEKYADKLREFRVGMLAEPWTIRSRQSAGNRITAKCGGYAKGELPEVPTAIILTVDVQKDMCWYVVRAWCNKLTSYLLEWGNVLRLEDIADIAKRQYGDGYAITHVFIDHGFRSSEVETLAKANRFQLVKGSDSSNAKRHGQSIWGKTATDLPLLLFYSVGLKDALTDKIEGPRERLGSWYVYDGIEAEYVSQMCSEHVPQGVTDNRGFPVHKWEKIGTANHLWDCEYYQLGAALAMGVQHQPPPIPINVVKEQAKRERDNRDVDPTLYHPRSERVQRSSGLQRPDGRDFFDLRGGSRF